MVTTTLNHKGVHGQSFLAVTALSVLVPAGFRSVCLHDARCHQHCKPNALREPHMSGSTHPHKLRLSTHPMLTPALVHSDRYH